MQEDLNLINWYNTWLLYFGYENCKYMRTGGSSIARSYHMLEGKILEGKILEGKILEEQNIRG